MTTIAWDGKNVAADRRVLNGNLLCAPETKIKQVNLVGHGNCIAVGAGHCGAIVRMIERLEKGEQLTKDAENEEGILVVFDDKSITIYSDGHKYDHPIGEPCAWGSGAELARGAMIAGADAKQAIEIASKVDIYTGDGVDTRRLSCMG